MKRLKGFIDLMFDAVGETTNLVERTHLAVAKRSVRRFVPVEPLSTPAQAVNEAHEVVASGVYKSIRVVNRGIRAVLNVGADLVISQANMHGRQNQDSLATPSASNLPDGFSKTVDRAQAAVNGLYGDYLHQRQNNLSLDMSIRHGGRALPRHPDALGEVFTNSHRKICVFVHGLGLTESMWSMGSERHYSEPGIHFGSRLEADCGYTPVFMRYNTGRHISENGRLLSELLSEVLSAYPKDIEEIIVIGHSMGGLVARSATHYGNKHNEAWVSKLRHIFCIASPHLGAPLEKGVNLLTGILRTFSTAGTQVPAEILNARSAGIKDLRFGYTLDEEWTGKDPDGIFDNNRQNIPLLNSVRYHSLAATITRDPHAPEPARRIPFRSRQILAGIGHLNLTNHPDVYDVIRQCMDAPERAH